MKQRITIFETCKKKFQAMKDLEIFRPFFDPCLLSKPPIIVFYTEEDDRLCNTEQERQKTQMTKEKQENTNIIFVTYIL